MSTRSVQIGTRSVGAGTPPYIIAELSANHLGQLDRALFLMEEAKAAGADAVKLQTYTADTITIDHHGPGFDIKTGPWAGRSLYELYQEAHTPWDWHAALFDKGRELDIAVFSSPFDATAVDFLEQFDPPAYKIASFECIDPMLIRYAAAKGKPLVISTGMANFEEVTEAVEAATNGGANGVIVLHCVSGYPTPAEEANLRTIPHLADSFDWPVGLSDHTLGTAVPVSAIAMGASVIEKHMTSDRSEGGPDAVFSLEPNEFRLLVKDCQTAWAALGDVDYTQKASEEANAQFRRSLDIVADVAAGELLTEVNVRSIRPGFGLAPGYFERVIGHRASRGLRRGTPLDLSCVDWGDDPIK